MIPDEIKALLDRLTDDERTRLGLVMLEDLLPGKGLALFMFDEKVRTMCSNRNRDELKPVLAEWAINELIESVKAGKVANEAISKAAKVQGNG